MSRFVFLINYMFSMKKLTEIVLLKGVIRGYVCLILISVLGEEGFDIFIFGRGDCIFDVFFGSFGMVSVFILILDAAYILFFNDEDR